ncbi:MAG: hypothetical protein OXE99_09820 [Cellvibrionales bacterium]|nr:hypothetical protein [Cellvibrionales bacterium]
MKYLQGIIAISIVACLTGCNQKEIPGNLRVYSDYNFISKKGTQYLHHGDYNGTVIVKKGKFILNLDLVTKSGLFVDEYAKIEADFPYYKTWLSFNGEHKQFSAQDLNTNFGLDVYLKKSQTIQHVSTTQNCVITTTTSESRHHRDPWSRNYVEVTDEVVEEHGVQTLDYDLVDNYEDYNIGFINPDNGTYIAEFHGVSHTSSQKNTVLGACTVPVNLSTSVFSISLPPIKREEHIYIFR